jgi:hypothetical protein
VKENKIFILIIEIMIFKEYFIDKNKTDAHEKENERRR